jgi:hypothetical protein
MYRTDSRIAIGFFHDQAAEWLGWFFMPLNTGDSKLSAWSWQ